MTTGHNAEEIIERFGGIRPMATKLNIPVTTVQGWKKRNFIPENRIAEIRKAAEQNNITIDDLIAKGAAPQISATSQQPAQASQTFQKPQTTTAPPAALSENQLDALVERRVQERLAGIEKKTFTKGIIINVGLLAVTAAAVIAILWPYKEMPEQNQQALQTLQTQVGSLKGDLAGMKKEQGFLEGMKKDIEQVKTNMQTAASQAATISNDMMTGTLEQRITKLEGHVGTDLAGSMMSDLLARYQTMTQSVQGQGALQGVVSQLNTMLPQKASEEETNAALEKAASENPAVGATFQGVPTTDLKAAAMLLGMTQFRSSLGRDKQPFANDLQLLMKLSGGSDPALTESLTKLAPYAEQGILTPRGLTDEFKGITGDVVVASLNGEDVSFEDKAKARLNEVFKVKKNGELITGTPTQATLAKTETLLNAGNIEEAIKQMQTLQGPAGATAAPWISQAQATLLAQKMKMTISHAINAKAAGSITAGGGPLIPGTLVRDEGTGINILKQDSFNHDKLYKKN